MQYQSEQLYPSLPSIAESLQKQSLNTTFMHSCQDSQALPLANHPHNHSYAPSHHNHLDAHIPHAEQYVLQLMQRLSQIASLFVHHSQQESADMEKRAGLKAMSIESSQLPPDFSNKMNIIEDMAHLMGRLEEESNCQHIRELLDTKFEQYYLERHYGGLNCEFNNLSIQDRNEQQSNSASSSTPSKNEGNIHNQSHSGYLCANSNVNSHIAGHQPSSGIGISNINYVSLVNQSKITYSQDFCQTGEDYQYNIEVPRIIQVQIPVVIYKIKEMVISYDQNDLISQFNNIDDIINRYSQPYEDLYQTKVETTNDAHVEIWKRQQKIQHVEFWKFDKETEKEESSMPLTSNIQPIGSIMLDSHMDHVQKETEIELSYSDFPEQPTFKLPLDSYAQLQSLISNESHLSDRTSHSPSDRDHLSSQTILITEKISSSIIEKYQEIQKKLMEENQEIKETLQALQQKFVVLKKTNKELEAQNNRLVRRLEEQIQQSAYFQKKLEESDAQILEQRVQCLTHLSEAKQRKIEHLLEEVSHKTQDISYLQKQLEEMTISLEKAQQQLHKKEQELILLNRQLQENQKELQQLNKQEQDIMMIAGKSQLNLKRQIEILQVQKADLQEKVKDYEKRLQSEGISLQYEQAKQIQGIIEEQEHVYSVQLQEVTKKYEEIIQGYQKEIEDLKGDLKEMQTLKNIAKEDAEEIRKQARSDLKETKISNSLNESYLGEIEEIIKEYDRQLEIKDEEILKLKQMLNQRHFRAIIERSSKAIELLEGQLKRQRQEKTQLTAKLIEIDVLIKRQISNQQTKKNNQDQTKIIQQLSGQLEKKSHQIAHLQDKLLQKDTLIILSQPKQTQQLSNQYHAENIRLHKINAKLKRYTKQLENEIRSFSAIDECEYHSNLLNRMTQQRNFLLGLTRP